MPKNWFEITARGDAGCEVSIYDEIGTWGVTAKDFRDEFSAISESQAVTLRINSPGGSVFDALAIYNILDRHPAPVSVVIDGLAASAASYIAMAGDTLTMPENAFIMIHNPWIGVVGDADEMREMADFLDKVSGSLVRGYATKTGKDDDVIAAMMANETWFSASEALDYGLADEVTAAVRVAARFDAKRFTSAPKALQNSPERSARASVPHPSEGEDMTTETARASGGGDTVLDAQASAKMVADARSAGIAEGRDAVLAIMNLPEASGREAAAAKMASQGATPEMAATLLAMIPVADSEVTPSQEAAAPDMTAIATSAANAAIKAMMDTAEGTGIEAMPEGSKSAELPDEATMRV